MSQRQFNDPYYGRFFLGYTWYNSISDKRSYTLSGEAGPKLMLVPHDSKPAFNLGTFKERFTQIFSSPSAIQHNPTMNRNDVNVKYGFRKFPEFGNVWGFVLSDTAVDFYKPIIWLRYNPYAPQGGYMDTTSDTFGKGKPVFGETSMDLENGTDETTIPFGDVNKDYLVDIMDIIIIVNDILSSGSN
jgi:hypothetical protein